MFTLIQNMASFFFFFFFLRRIWPEFVMDADATKARSQGNTAIDRGLMRCSPSQKRHDPFGSLNQYVSCTYFSFGPPYVQGNSGIYLRTMINNDSPTVTFLFVSGRLNSKDETNKQGRFKKISPKTRPVPPDREHVAFTNRRRQPDAATGDACFTDHQTIQRKTQQSITSAMPIGNNSIRERTHEI